MAARCWTIGHSDHPLALFVELLDDAGIELVADVRTAPYSRWVPHFNRDPLRAALAGHAIDYEYLGAELGGRPRSERAQGPLEPRPGFERGIARLCGLIAVRRVALLCAEEDPARCHRHLLVAARLVRDGIEVGHLRGDGRVESAAEIARRAPRQGELF